MLITQKHDTDIKLTHSLQGIGYAATASYR